MTKRCTMCRLDLPPTEFYERNGALSGRCKTCQKKTVTDWREKNRERHNANAKRWRDANKDKVKETNQHQYQKNREERDKASRAWRLANPEKQRESERKWREKPESKIIQRERSKRWRREHPLRTAKAEREWRQRNPQAVRAFAKTRRAVVAGAPINDFTANQWAALQAAFDHRCAYCDKRCKGRLTQDHIVPLSKGGSHTASNIVPACGPCNSTKHTGPPLRPVQPLLLAP